MPPLPPLSRSRSLCLSVSVSFSVSFSVSVSLCLSLSPSPSLSLSHAGWRGSASSRVHDVEDAEKDVPLLAPLRCVFLFLSARGAKPRWQPVVVRALVQREVLILTQPQVLAAERPAASAYAPHF